MKSGIIKTGENMDYNEIDVERIVSEIVSVIEK